MNLSLTYFLFSLFVLNLVNKFDVFSATVFSSSLKTCQSQCEERNLAYPLPSGQLKWINIDKHNYTESVGSCRHGCEDVDERESKCDEKCSEENVVSESCQQGCRAVLVAFLAQAQAMLIKTRVNMEVHDTGMKLKWEFPEEVIEDLKELATADIFWFAQTRPLNGNIGWRWTSLTQGAFRNSTLSTEITVPFEEAEQVEVRLAMSYRNQVLVSRTTQYDLPLSKSGTHLEIVGQLQLSDDRVAICYKTNQPTPKFKLTISTLDGNPINTEESISRCHMFSNLPIDNCCKANIAAIDENGIITASLEVKLDFFVNKVEAELIAMSQTRLIFTNGTHLLDLEDSDNTNLSESSNIIPFPLPADDSITAIVGISENTIAIGSEKGSLWTFQMSNSEMNQTFEEGSGEKISSEVIQLKTVGEMDTKIMQIEVDHIQKMIYAVQHDKGILRCKLRTLQSEEPTSSCVLIVNNDPLNPPKEITLDPVNGFIYTLNADAKVYKTEMIAFNASGIESIQNFQLLKDLSPSNGIFYDWQKFVIYSALQNGSLLSMNPINDQVHIFRDGDFANFRVKSDKIFWSRSKCGESTADTMCIFSENLKRGEDDLPNKFTYDSALLDYTFLEEIFVKPRVAAISQISMLVSDKSAKIAWSRQQNLPFQAQGLFWRNMSYFLKITTPENDPQEVYLETNSYSIDIKSGKTYTAQIQACSDDFCSTPRETENTAMRDFKEITPYVFTKKHQDGIEVFDGLGNIVEADETLRNLDKMGSPHALDNTTKTVYLAGDHSMGIYKKELTDLTGTPKPFKDGLFVEMMSVIPSKSMIVIGSSYKITSYRLPTTFDYEYYTCEEPLEDCAEVMGISADDTTGKVFFITQHRNGTVSLWESTLTGNRQPVQISSTDSIRPFRKFLVVQDKIIMLTKSGHIIQTDTSLETVNEWREGPRVETIVPIRYAQQIHKIEFIDDIKFVEGSKTDLIWNVTPPMDNVIFKVSIYREKMGMDNPIMNMQTETNYTIQQNILDQWMSAQRFDVSVQAITPWLTVTQNKTGLTAPVKPPTPPTQLRIYATQQKTVDGPRALISFFWSPPLEWNGTPYQFIVNCTKDDGSWIGGPVTSSQSHYSFAVKSGKVSCQVAAANEPTNIGGFSDVISIDSSEIKPLVKLFAIDSTNSLVSINDLAHEEPSRETRQVSQPAKLEYQALAFIGEDLYAVRKEGDSAQPVLVKIDTNHYENTVHKVSIGGDVTRIDAMTSDWVGHRLLFVAGTVLYQLPLEPFLSTSLLNPHKVMQISSAATDAKQLTYDPFKNTAYLLTKNGSLFALDLNSKTESNLALTISCLAAQTITWMQTEFTWNRAVSPKIYALTWNGLLYVDLAEDYQCNEVRIDWTKFGEKGIKAISSFAISDKLFAFVTSSEMLIYGRDMITPIPITNPPLKQILAASQSSQPYPDRSCFELPSSKGIVFSIVNEGKTGAFLEVTKSTLPSACTDVSMPQTQYEIYFTRKNTDKVKHIRSFSDKIHIENAILDKETDYDVTVTWLNRYSPASGVSPSKPFRTGFGYPSAPRDPHAIPVSPDTVYLYWNLPETLNAPISEIKYKISQQAAGLTSPTSIAVIPLSEVVSTNISSDTTACLINPCRVKIANLRPSNEYKFWVTATHTSHLYSTFMKDDEAVSIESTARTLDVPGTLRPENVTGSSIILRWNGLEPETLPNSLSVQYREVGHNDWEEPVNATILEPNVATEIIPVNTLLSATTYDYRFVATYTGTYTIDGKVLAYKEDYFQLTQQARTKAGVPTMPQNVESRIDEEGWIVTWKEPMSDGGSPITSYAVETRINKTAEWEIAERGLDGWKMWWRPGKSETNQLDLEFRIRAANIEGFGGYAYTEERKEIPEEKENVILPYFLFLLIVLLILALLFVLWFWLKSRRAQFVKKREAQDERNCISLDVVTNLTLSPTQSLPPEINNELKNLPHVNKEDVKIGAMIAHGTYGHVHEGVAAEVPLSWEKNVKVAIKTLENYDNYENKVMFMKEAILLNNVDHPNIVKELGVCLTQRSEFLLLEFMEGGNLLEYLRMSVPTENQASELCLRDLLGIAVDVARGMNYLERLPHVHKDLCAKRCLLASKSGGPTKLELTSFPITNKFKIESSDRIRWMSPEILRDFQFTSKSDVWAFGVLLFEIFSLGEHPHGTEKENRKIATDVRNGVVLPKPVYCPDRLYKLMQQCWAFDPTKRPNFATILKIFESFRERLEFQDDKPLQAQDGHYNVNFDVSHDSTSSERGDSREPPSPSHLNKSFGGFENHAFEKNTLGSIVNARKSSKSAAGRSLRKEKVKSRKGVPQESFESTSRPLSVHSADTISTEFSGERGLNSPGSSGMQYLAPYDAVKSRMSAAPALGIVNDGFEGSNPSSLNLSRSWTALSEAPRPAVRSRAPTYEQQQNNRRNRVSQVSMTTESPPKRKMGKKGTVLEESLPENSLYLFQDETLSPIFCKSKLIPLKTITMQKLEKMQQEMMEKLKFPEKPEEIHHEEGEYVEEGTSSERDPIQNEDEEKKSTDVWTADD
ncbi:unnamed protein product [Caenorhabditis angaria]|uniref:Receptor protein-tyrosine kinase n=1 Tax=Caenorhabditis angaria TaxID=860376 RepID=A0A9P1IZX0_9PELO|nr:unnamed protein product [Caenorhabditis angaria]